MTLVLVLTAAALLAAGGRVHAQPLTIQENAPTEHVLMQDKCCNEGSLVLTNSSELPWKYFKVVKNQRCSSVVLNSTIDDGETNTRCWPKEPWSAKGTYHCSDSVHRETPVDVILDGVQNKYSPTFCDNGCKNITNQNIDVRESMAVGSEITKVNICDGDFFRSDQPIFEISSNIVTSRRSSDNPEVTILLKTELDYESNKTHTIPMHVRDSVHNTTYNMTLTLNVIDTDDQGPEFTQKVYHCNVTEKNYTTLTSIEKCSVKATDLDTNINATIGYSVLDTGTGDIHFNVNGSGYIQVAGNLDRETVSSYVLPIKGYQLDRPSDRFDFAAVVLTVTDVDDNLPVFTQPASSISIVENSPNGTLVYQFTAIDADEGPSAEFTYQLVGNQEAFEINSTNGKVTVKNSLKLDRERHSTSFVIQAMAVPKNQKTRPTASLTIDLIDVNDNSPKFIEPNYTVTINKTHPVGKVLQVKAHDDDDGPNGQVRYTLIDQPIDSPFSIDKKSGTLSLDRPISETFLPVYNLVVQAEDQAENPSDRRSSTVPVKVHVSDSNTHAPTVSILSTLNVPESAEIGTIVALIKVSDKDTADHLTVTLSDGHQGIFFAFNDSFKPLYEIVVNSKLDREWVSSYDLTVVCNDSIHQATRTVKIAILDDNDNVPKFPDGIAFSINESLPAGHKLGTVKATDADSGNNSMITYTIDRSSQWIANFTVNNTSGVIETVGVLDREALGDNKQTLLLPVLATDHGAIPLTGTATVTVTILDVNDNPPAFDKANITISVKERSTLSVIYTAKASDPDMNDNGEIEYKLNNQLSLFKISQSSGEVSAINPLTYGDSVNGDIHLQIVALDKGIPQQSASQSVIIKIQDVNDHHPQFNSSNYSFNILETSVPNTLVGRVTAYDEDILPENKDILFHLASLHSDVFRIDPSTGEIFLLKSIDCDLTDSITTYNLTVFASNKIQYTDAQTNSSATIVISVTPVNEYNPHFNKATYQCSVKEEYTGQFDCIVTAEDEDAGLDGHVTYNVTNSSIFTIDQQGHLNLRKKLNYERPESDREYFINVSASDGGTPRKTDYAVVMIRVLNENDCPPRILMPGRVNVSEGVVYTRSYIFAELNARDEDGDLNAFTFVIDPPVFPFMNHHDDYVGLNTSAAGFKFEYNKQPSYTLQILVNDSVHTNTKPFFVDVIQVNRYQPVFKANYSFQIPENGEWNGTLHATDSDKGAFGKVHYALDIPQGIMPRNISLSSNGDLVISNLDRETTESFTLTVLAIDGGSPSLTGVTVVDVRVTGVDDNIPYYLDSYRNVTIAVNEETEYTNIFTSMALDDDIGNGSVIQYALAKGNTSLFTVTKDGKLSIHPLTMDKPTITIQIEASNPGSPSHKTTQNVIVHVKDINDNIPVFEPKSYNVNISECSGMDTLIVKLNAKDKDVDPRYNTVTYWLAGAIDSYTGEIPFAIDSHTGEIRLKERLDFDLPGSKKRFSFTAFATDLGKFDTSSNHTASAHVTITVHNCNDNPPIFATAVQRCQLKEEQSGPFNCTLKATDVDHLQPLQYSILGDKQNFTVDSKSGVISARELDYENPATKKLYVLNVSCTDGNFTSFSTILVDLVNMNDNTPKFKLPKDAYEFRVPENVLLTSIGNVIATDADGDSICYTMTGNCSGLSIDMGRLALDQQLDFENIQVCSMVVKANDSTHTSSVLVTVKVTDVNDNVPQFAKDVYHINILEDTQVSTSIQKISASDADGSSPNNNVTYRIISGSDGVFEVQETTGDLTLQKSLNASLQQVYTVVIEARDGGEPSLTNSTVVTIDVLDVNDNAPVFLYTPYKAQVTENTPEHALLQIFATDVDPDSKLTFSVSKMNKYFYINDSILYVRQLDIETLNSSNIHVELIVSDGKYNTTTSVDVTVLDVNDNYPYFINAPYPVVQLNDTTPNGTRVTDITAKDDDFTNFNITYFLYHGNGYFDIGRSSGRITLQKTMDDIVEQFNLTVVVFDGGSPLHSNETLVKVKVVVTNEYAPEFKLSNGSDKILVDFRENQLNQFVNLSATDHDVGAAGYISYSIKSNAERWPQNFKFDNKTGILTLIGEVDYEHATVREYSFEVTASDHATFPKSTTALVIVRIVDVDEAPELILPTPTVYKELNATANSTISKVTVNDTDLDTSFRNFTFAIIPASDLFQINQQGEISAKKVLNVAKTFKLNITVTDGGGLWDSKILTVTVSNITGFNLHANVTEGNPPPVSIVDLHKATNMTDLVFKLDKPGNLEYFEIATNGTLLSKKTFDRENTQYFFLDIKGYKIVDDDEILKAQVQVNVTINDVNDNAPVFNKSHYSLELSEKSTINSTVGIVTATDKDKESVLRYKIDPTSDTFGIDRKNGSIHLLKHLDYESVQKYNLTVVCEDSVYSGNATIEIIVLDENDCAPTFGNKTYYFQVYESHVVGVIDGTIVNATDPDTADIGKLNYSVIPDSQFSIDNHGQLSLKQPLDYDTMGTVKQITFTVRVQDTAQHSSKATVIINVLDSNDITPNFTRPEYIFHVLEGITVLGNNFSVKAEDEDSGENGKLTFRLGGKEDRRFNIGTNGNTGYLHILTALDRETTETEHLNGSAVYTLTVTATDNGNPQLSSTATIRLFVDDVNDCTPQFNKANYSVSIQEGTSVGTTVLSVSTTDCDYLPEYTHIWYSLSGDNHNVFNISQAGDIVLKKEVSVQMQATYNLFIIASDSRNQNNTSLLVTVQDANDHSPNFTQPIYKFEVSENEANVSIGTVLAKDEDPGENGEVSYSITSGNSNKSFDIIKLNDSVWIHLVSKLDREKIEAYSLIITASDNAKSGRRQGTCTVMIKVLDENDNSPVFNTNSGYTASVREDASKGLVLKINPPITATDVDWGINGTQGIIYQLSQSNPFCVNASDGDISVCGNLDREVQASYNLTVTAVDSLGKKGSRQTNTSLTITVQDVNDSPPQFLNASYAFSVYENATSGTSVGEVTVTDADENGVQRVTVEIIHGSLENFYITQAVNDSRLVATIYVSGVLDRETTPEYNLTISAYDLVARSKISAIIEIKDINDNSPIFNKTNAEVAVAENSPPAILHTVSAYDLDQPNTANSEIRFSLSLQTLQEHNETFGLYENGSLYTKVPLDREKVPQYTLLVIARDNGTPAKSSETSITVQVLDINDNPPQFCPETTCFQHSYVVESAPANSIIALPVATDPDNGNNGTIVYSILQSNATKYFTINNKTGLVAIGRPIVINTLLAEHVVKKSDNSSKSVSMNLTVEARDKGPNGGLNSSLTLEITVEEINDNAPLFQHRCDFNVTEGKPSGTYVGTCDAIIPNATYSHMTYGLIAGFGRSSFEINSNGSISTVAVLDREKTSQYSLSVQVTDGRTPERTAFAAVSITVNDVNDNSPEFYQSPIIKREIPENSNLTRTINASAFDRDDGQNGLLSFTISNNYGGLFAVNDSTGLVTINGVFDHENCPSYSFTIVATDHGSSPLSSSTLVKISVVDVNDNDPVFHDVQSVYEIPENATGKVFVVHATDMDSGLNGNVVFKLKNNDGGPFIIDPMDGSVYLDGRLDFRSRQEYRLTLEAKDQGQQPRAALVNVTVKVKMILAFAKDVYEIYVDRNASVGTQILNLTIHGADAVYKVSGEDSTYFSISDTGILSVRAALGAQNMQDVITVTAGAHGQKAECKVIINIRGHGVIFPKSHFTVSLLENLNESTLLLDLNATEELKGEAIVYAITRVEPNVGDVFRVEQNTGRVYCDKSLDREVHGEYKIYISAFLSSATHRRRREIDEPSTVFQLTVHVDDEDDNPPSFNRAQEALFGVPDDARADYLVTQLQATDPDLGENGKILYTATGDTDVFGIDMETGEVKTLVAIASKKGRTSFKLAVKAQDVHMVQGQTLNVQIVVVPQADRLMLQVNSTLTDFRRKQTDLIGNMSHILGVEVQLELAESHREQTESGTKLDITRTDMYFHGLNKSSGAIVPFDVMNRLISKSSSELEKLFGNGRAVEVTQVVKLVPVSDPSAVTVPVIALITVAVFIFFGSVIAILMAQYSWTRMKDKQKEIEAKQQANMELNDFEMGTLKSHNSKTDLDKTAAAAAATNPAFVETEFNNRTTEKNKKAEFETQEICIDLPPEPFRFSSETLNNNNNARSVADSAIENTSVSSSDQHKSEASSRSPGHGQNNEDPNQDTLKVDDGPMMTSSPRISRDEVLKMSDDTNCPRVQTIVAQPNAASVDDVESSKEKMVTRDRVLTFTMESGETQTEEDELDDCTTDEIINDITAIGNMGLQIDAVSYVARPTEGTADGPSKPSAIENKQSVSEQGDTLKETSDNTAGANEDEDETTSF